jgi:cell wall-associated NlpC family hydrolase
MNPTSIDILQRLPDEFQYRELKGIELRTKQQLLSERERIIAENQQFIANLESQVAQKERAKAEYHAAVSRGNALCALASVTLLSFMVIPPLNHMASQTLKLYEWTNTASSVIQAQSASATPVVQSKTNSNEVSRIVAAALSWGGKDYKPRESARCADFVRRVFRDAGFNLGITNNPIDGREFRVTWATANSFFGTDVGTFIDNPEDWRPGDLISFRNTYGNWGPRAITHVGILVEKKNGVWYMVDRGTSTAPVHHRRITHFGTNKIGPVIRPTLNPR